MPISSAKHSRRDVIKLLASLGLGAALTSSLSSCFQDLPDKPSKVPPPPPGDRYKGELPNVVLVVVDDLAANVMGDGGRFSFLETPNVSRLQREGATFERAYVPSSVCSPSRASLLTGTYPHTHGVKVNDIQDLVGQLPNLPEGLEAAGYDTAFIGKWHMDNNIDAPRMGFDYWLSFPGQGHYQENTFNENGHRFKAKGYITDLLTEYAVNYVQTVRQKPFFMVVSHKAAHQTFEAADRHKSAFKNATLPEPPNFGETFEGKPEWQRLYKLCNLALDAPLEGCKDRTLDVPGSLAPEPWNAHDDVRLEYLRTLLAVDEGLGDLFTALTNMEQLDNTVFIFTSDNGFMYGAHRLTDKRIMYEESIRVPLVIRYPKGVQAGTKNTRLVSSLDLAPTLLEIAGQPVPETMLGSSLLPLFVNPGAPWRDRFLYEYFQERPEAGPAVPNILGVRTERYKYAHYPDLPDDVDELYDLETDPFELRNLIADPAYAVTLGELQGSLQQQLVDTGYTDSQLASRWPVETLFR